MAEFKVVIGDKSTKKCYQKEIKDDMAEKLIGLKIGDAFAGEILDLPGYELQITGGSDYCGFPMRKDVTGAQRKIIFAVKGVGVKNKKHLPNPKKKIGKKYLRTMKGMRRKKTVAGNTVYEKTAQINAKVIKAGSQPIEKPAEPEAPAEGEAKKEE